MTPTTRPGRSDALNSARPVVTEVLAALAPGRVPAGHPARPDNGHYEIAISSLTRLDAILRTEAGLRRVRNDGEARPGEFRGGRQLFYLRGNVLVRVKTRGTAMRPRAHVTISMVDHRGNGDQDWHTWNRERCKFTANGNPAWKNISDGSSPNPYSFPTAIIDGLTAGQQDRWADDCHFDLPANFDATGEMTLLPE